MLSNIAIIEDCERKARTIEVHPETPTTGWYRIHGRLARVIPWTGDFSYTHHDVGWHSQDRSPRSDNWAISGGFIVSPVDGQTCRITHYEDFRLPGALRLLRAPIAAYIRCSQVAEMRDLTHHIETAPADVSRDRGPGSPARRGPLLVADPIGVTGVPLEGTWTASPCPNGVRSSNPGRADRGARQNSLPSTPVRTAQE